MKRFWLVILSLGLVLAFSASAMAVDVKFSGSFYAAGMYLDKTNFLKNTSSDGISTAFYYQRLRVGTEFIVSPGLSLVTRFDAMERAWGAPRSNPGAAADLASSGTTAENENIAFDHAYVRWTTPIGILFAGYMSEGTFGTQFLDSTSTIGKVQFASLIGPLTLATYAAKQIEGSVTAKNSTGRTTDSDFDKYVLMGMYKFNNDTSAGLLYTFYNVRAFKLGPGPLSPNSGAILKMNATSAFVKSKIGPVSIESEFLYLWGNYNFENNVTGKDRSVTGLNAYLGLMADFGPAYVGANFAYISGDDPGTTDKMEGGIAGGGWDWNPCLIMFNFDRTYWAGSLGGYNSSVMNNGIGPLGTPLGMNNAWFAQGLVGGRPIPALDIKASLAWATADQQPTGFLNKTYGYEVDVTGTYKITNNLSYMLGVGYLFTGDYFKGTSVNNSVKDDYLLINKLTLTF